MLKPNWLLANFCCPKGLHSFLTQVSKKMHISRSRLIMRILYSWSVNYLKSNKLLSDDVFIDYLFRGFDFPSQYLNPDFFDVF